VATSESKDPFVPADARWYCKHCGFRFRGGARDPLLCRTYDDPAHGRCGRRLRDAQDPEGLRKRLRKTQETDPYVRRTSEDAVAYEWAKQHYPKTNLQDWEPCRP
jgi:hypothetical protein